MELNRLIETINNNSELAEEIKEFFRKNTEVEYAFIPKDNPDFYYVCRSKDGLDERIRTYFSMYDTKREYMLITRTKVSASESTWELV